MKIALLVEEGRQQIVLTPESDTEKSILKLLGPETRTLKIQAYRGGFYRCEGGWTRETLGKDDSAIIVLEAA